MSKYSMSDEELLLMEIETGNFVKKEDYIKSNHIEMDVFDEVYVERDVLDEDYDLDKLKKIVKEEVERYFDENENEYGYFELGELRGERRVKEIVYDIADNVIENLIHKAPKIMGKKRKNATTVKYDLTNAKMDFTEMAKDEAIFNRFKDYLYYASANAYPNIEKFDDSPLYEALSESFIIRKIADNIKDKKFVVEDIDKFTDECVEEFIEEFKKRENLPDETLKAAAIIMYGEMEHYFFKKLRVKPTKCQHDEDIRREFAGLPSIWYSIDNSTSIKVIKSLAKKHYKDAKREGLMDIEREEFYELFDRVMKEDYDDSYKGYVYTYNMTQSEVIEDVLDKIKQRHSETK